MTGESVRHSCRRLRLETAGRALRRRWLGDRCRPRGSYGSPRIHPCLPQALRRRAVDYRRAVVAPRYMPALSLELTFAGPRCAFIGPFGRTDMDVAIEIFPDRLAACCVTSPL